MEKRKILIADSADDFRSALTEALYAAYRVRSAGEGMQALQLLRSFSPDILVLDLLLPGLDGITLLQKAAEEGVFPVVLATTRYVSEYILEMAERLNVGYIMVKPCDVGAAAARIADLSQRLRVPTLSHPDPRSAVSNVLLRLGISTKLRGYGYLREAILLMAADPRQSITKELYPAVAAIFDASVMQIERSVRSAVANAWRRHDRQIWQMYFPVDDTGAIPRPTNAAFVSRLADQLILHREDAAQE